MNQTILTLLENKFPNKENNLRTLTFFKAKKHFKQKFFSNFWKIKRLLFTKENSKWEKIKKTRKKYNAQVFSLFQRDFFRRNKRRRYRRYHTTLVNKRRTRKRQYKNRLLKIFNRSLNLKKENYKPFSRKITIKVKQNNIFFHVQKENNVENEKPKTLLVGSVGKYRIRTSRKLLRWVYERIFNKFFWEAKKIFDRGGWIVVLTAPRRLRKWILRLIRNKSTYKVKRPTLTKAKIKTLLKKKLDLKFKTVYRRLLIKIVDKKIFNGCRAAKKRRKKRKPRRLKR